MDFGTMSKRQQQYVVLGALGVVGLLYGLYLIIFGVMRLDKTSRTQLEDLTAKIEQAEQALHNESKLRESVANVGGRLDELLRLMPEYENEFIWATERVYEWMRETDIELSSVDPLPSPALGAAGSGSKRWLGSYAVRISATGGYNQLRRFLKKVELGNPLVSVQRLEIGATRSASFGGHQLRVDLSWPKLLAEEGAQQ